MKKAIVAILMVPVMAHAEFWSGNDLHKRIVSPEPLERLQAMAYVMGIYDAYVNLYFCPPNGEAGITAGQVNDMARLYLSASPAKLHFSAHSLLREAFHQVWPCRRGVGV